MGNRIDISFMFVVYLCNVPKLKPKIEEIYNSNEETFYKFFLESGCADSDVFKTLTITTESLLMKAIGIFQYSQRTGDEKNILKIIQELNPHMKKYVKPNRNISFQDFYNKYLKHKVKKMSEAELLANRLSFFYLVLKDDLNNVNMTENDLQNLNWAQQILKNPVVKMDSYKELLLSNKDKIAILNKKYFLDTALVEKSISIDTYIANLIDDGIVRYSEKDPKYLQGKNITDKDISQIYNIDPYKYFPLFGTYLEILGVNKENIFIESEICKNDIDIILSNFIENEQLHSLTDLDFGQYFVAALFILNFVRLNEAGRKQYMKDAYEERRIKIEKHEKEIEKEKEELRKEKKCLGEKADKYEIEMEKLRKQIKELHGDLAEARTENRALKKQIKNNEKMNKDNEDAVLESNIICDSEEPTVVAIEEAIEALSSNKIALFGGNNNIARIKDKLPNIELFNDERQDISNISSYDYIYINTQFFNHSFSKRIEAVLKNKKPIRAVTGTNIEKLIIQMYNHTN